MVPVSRAILGFFIEGFLVNVSVAVTEAAIGSFILGGSGGMLPRKIVNASSKKETLGTFFDFEKKLKDYFYSVLLFLQKRQTIYPYF